MSDDERTFLDSICAEPDDDSLRLVYADWLEDQGDGRAEYLRLECVLTKLPLHERQAHPGWPRLLMLGDQLSADWKALMNRTPIENCRPQQFPQGDRCPRVWSALTPTDDHRRRLCSTCAHHVRYCDSITAALRQIAAGERVAIDLSRPRRLADVTTG